MNKIGKRDPVTGRVLPGWFEDLTGRRFGSLVVIGEGSKTANGVRRWLCKCDCGGTALAQAHFLKNEQKACKECSRRARTLHGHAKTPNMTPTYRSWQAMLARCYKKHDGDYPNYGGRGIRVCDRWRHDFAAFLADMGERPPGTTIDRYPDNNGNYEPSNCRWATPKMQIQNRRVTKLEAHEPAQIRWLVSEGYSKSSVARFFGIAVSGVCKIINGDHWAGV